MASVVHFDDAIARDAAFDRLIAALLPLDMQQIIEATGYKAFQIRDVFARKTFPAWETLDKLAPLLGKTPEEIAGRPRNRKEAPRAKAPKGLPAAEKRLYGDLSWARPIYEINKAARDKGLSYGEYVWRCGSEATTGTNAVDPYR